MRTRRWAGLLLATTLFLPAQGAWAADEDDEIEGLDDGLEVVPLRRLDVVQNKSFTKAGRLEIYPHALGMVSNNHFARRQILFTGASVAYHLGEQVYLEVTGEYIPYSEGDIKALTFALLSLNAGSENAEPVNVPAETLYVGGSVGFSPIYGKLNLAGEHVQNFDVSFVVGGGLLSVENHRYTFGGYTDTGGLTAAEIAGSPETVSFGTGHVGISSRFPLTSWLTLKGDARLLGYLEEVPDYLSAPQVINGETVYDTKTTFASSFLVTVGASVFVF